MALLLGIDLGTSYFKVGLYDSAGGLRGLGRVAVEPHRPAPERIELPAELFWERLRKGLALALHQAGAAAGDIAGLSYSSQANTFVLLDADDAPLTPLIFWNDRRAYPLAGDLARFSGSEAFRRTAGFAGWAPESAVAKWRWLMENEPGTWARARRGMTISDYLTFALTGERAGDASTASLTGLYDQASRSWWPEALAVAGVAREMLSEPLRPGSRCGGTTARAAALLGVPAGVPFAVGGLDHHVAAIGAGLGRFAEVSLSTGTVLAALSLVETVEPVAECYHGPHVDGRRFFRLAFDPNGAGQVEEYQRRQAPEHSVAALFALATQSAAAPARPGFAAPPSDHGIAVRDLLERIATSHRELVRCVTGENYPREVAATGGGTRSALWLQIYADVLGARVLTPRGEEQACLGAAVLAAVAAGWHPGVHEAALAMVHADRVFEPSSPRT